MIVHHKILDLYETLDLVSDNDLDFTILSIPDIHPVLPYKSPVLQANYFSFILTEVGSGVFNLDDSQFPFSSKSFYFTNPGHIKSYELFDSKEAYIISLSDQFLQECITTEIYKEFPFLLAEKAPPHQLYETDFKEFKVIYHQIQTEFEKESVFKNKILGNLFTVLLYKVKEKIWSTYNPIEEGNRNSQIVKAFKIQLEKTFKQLLAKNTTSLQAQSFAKALNLHPNYLNSVIKSKTGRTVNDWISERTLSVAKTLLSNTSMSIKEIGYRLGFSEPTHFGRFFKKRTNTSATEFRKTVENT